MDKIKQEETFLNGEKVTDETRLDGDKIKIATTKGKLANKKFKVSKTNCSN